MRTTWLLARILATAVVCLPANAGPAADLLAGITSAALDPEACYRVRDVFLEREDIRLYFTDGHLIFGKPVAGRPIHALFTASQPTDEGEVLIIPPSERERASLNRALGETVLDEKFRTAILYFTDDTAAALRESFANAPIARQDLEKGKQLASRWDRALRDIIGNVSLRMLLDLSSPQTAGGGFFGGVISGGPKGAFDIAMDPRLDEQIHAGQVRTMSGNSVAETWTRFTGRSFEAGKREHAPAAVRLEDYRIQINLDAELALTAVARMKLVRLQPDAAAFPLRLSRRVRVTALTIGGEPVEYFQADESSPGSQRRLSEIVTVMLPHPAPAGGEEHLEVHYEGKVIEAAGNSVYFVGSRASWYPRGEPNFTSYELDFEYPAHLQLVATGDQIESETQGLRTRSRYITPSPIHLAGFNIGDYVRAERKSNGYTVEVLANRAAETRLEVQSTERIVLMPQAAARSRGAMPATASVVIKQPAPAPRPAEHVDAVADEALRAFTFFRTLLGEPPFEHLAITPIPGDFGQGFPGLVYASTLSFLRPGDAAMDQLSPQQQRFYIQLLPAHEISHQWWGHTVRVDAESENWLMESLATYSSLLYLEHEGGAAALRESLAAFQTHLLATNEDGQTVESAGPVVLGERLDSARFPNARRTIVYEKGAWIMHMLRGILGDDAFRELLAQLTSRFRFQPITTKQFQALAASLAPKDGPVPGLESFFDQWVYRTGIPKLSVTYRVEGKQAPFTLFGEIRQEDVPDHWTVSVPIEVTTATGSVAKQVTVDGPRTSFQVTALRTRPTGVLLDPQRQLLRQNP